MTSTPMMHSFELDDIMPLLQEGIQVLVKDDFTRCFAVQKPNHWNWNAYLFPMWLIGVVVRYCILLPIRYMRCATPRCPRVDAHELGHGGRFVIIFTGICLFTILFSLATTLLIGERRTNAEVSLLTYLRLLAASSARTNSRCHRGHVITALVPAVPDQGLHLVVDRRDSLPRSAAASWAESNLRRQPHVDDRRRDLDAAHDVRRRGSATRGSRGFHPEPPVPLPRLPLVRPLRGARPRASGHQVRPPTTRQAMQDKTSGAPRCS